MVIKQLLIDCLQALATEAPGQVVHLEALGLPDFDRSAGVDLRNVDELALNYAEAVQAAEALSDERKLSPAQLRCVKAIDELLDSISGPANEHLWTVDALYNAQEWRRVRLAARTCLRHFK